MLQKSINNDQILTVKPRANQYSLSFQANCKMANSLLPAAILVLAALAVHLNLATSSRVFGTCRANGHVRLQSKATGHCSTKSTSNCCEARKIYPRFHCSPPVKRSTPAIMTLNSFTRHGRVGGPNNVRKSKHSYLLPISRAHAVTTSDNTTTDGDGVTDNRFGNITWNNNTTTKGDNMTYQDDNRYATVTSNKNIHPRGTAKCDNKYHDDKQLVVALSTGWYNGGSRCLKNIRIRGNGKSVLAKVVDECDSVNGCDSRHGFRVPCANNIVDASPALWKALRIPKGKIGNYMITWSDV